MTMFRITMQSQAKEDRSKDFTIDIMGDDDNSGMPELRRYIPYFGCYGRRGEPEFAPFTLEDETMDFGQGEGQYAWTDLITQVVELGAQVVVRWNNKREDNELYAVTSVTEL